MMTLLVAAPAAARFEYADLDPASAWCTIVALILYVAFCLYGIWKCWRAQDDWSGILEEKSAPNGDAPTSFSRVAGAIGAYFLTGFFILIGAFVVSRLWFPPDQNGLKETLGSITEFIWAGVALFAPYAFNQVSQVFGKRDRTAGTSGAGEGEAEEEGGTKAPHFDPNDARPAFDPNRAGI